MIKSSESILNLAKALSKAQREMTTATKSSNNPFFKSKYADIIAINEAIMPALLNNGFSLLQPSVSINGKNYINTTLIHESGEYLSSLREIIVSKHNDPQAGIAGETYARRGSLQAFFNVGAEDDDGNTAAAREVKPAEKGSLQGTKKIAF